MASKHLKKVNTPAQGAHVAAEPKSDAQPKKSAGGKRLKQPDTPKKEASSKKPKAAKAVKETKASKASKSDEKAKTSKSSKASKPSDTAKAGKTDRAQKGEKASGKAKSPKKETTQKPAPLHEVTPLKETDGTRFFKPVKTPDAPAPKHSAPEPESKKPMAFRREKAEKLPAGGLLSQRDAVGAVIALIAALVLFAATVVVWFYRDSFSPDGMILSADNVAVPDDEYVFDAGSGQVFAAAGKGLAVANGSGLELLDGNGSPVTSKLMQMENPAAAGCDDFAVFYDLGGTRLAVARFDGSVEEITAPGDIISATVSQTGFIALTTEYTGRRALVTVYDPQLNEVYQWYSSSAWVISAHVSPDGRQLAVLSYTAAGSEVRFFSLTRTEQLASFSVAGTVLLDVHWFSSSRLCALSSEQAFFFNASGEWQNTYTFAGQYLVGYTFDGGNCAAFALSPYRAGTTATLVSLDATGMELGTAEVDSGIVCLAASNMEIMVLCSDGAILYNSSLSEKGRLNGLPGFKYALLRSRGEALLIAANYAEVYTF